MRKREGAVLVSACLLGVHCRYDGGTAANPDLLEELRGKCVVPVCPEQLGGLSTPRVPSEIVGGDGADVLASRARVVNEVGEDVTRAFVKGAEETLRLAVLLKCERAILKSRSPSCGQGQIYRNGELVEGDGVTVALLKRHGIEVETRDAVAPSQHE